MFMSVCDCILYNAHCLRLARAFCAYVWYEVVLSVRVASCVQKNILGHDVSIFRDSSTTVAGEA